MKKTLYIILALFLIGGTAYALTQSDLLKGSFVQRGNNSSTVNPDADPIETLTPSELIQPEGCLGIELSPSEYTLAYGVTEEALDIQVTVHGGSEGYHDWLSLYLNGQLIETYEVTGLTSTFPDDYDFISGSYMVEDGTVFRAEVQSYEEDGFCEAKELIVEQETAPTTQSGPEEETDSEENNFGEIIQQGPEQNDNEDSGSGAPLVPNGTESGETATGDIQIPTQCANIAVNSTDLPLPADYNGESIEITPAITLIEGTNINTYQNNLILSSNLNGELTEIPFTANNLNLSYIHSNASEGEVIRATLSDGHCPSEPLTITQDPQPIDTEENSNEEVTENTDSQEPTNSQENELYCEMLMMEPISYDETQSSLLFSVSAELRGQINISTNGQGSIDGKAYFKENVDGVFKEELRYENFSEGDSIHLEDETGTCMYDFTLSNNSENPITESNEENNEVSTNTPPSSNESESELYCNSLILEPLDYNEEKDDFYFKVKGKMSGMLNISTDGNGNINGNAYHKQLIEEKIDENFVYENFEIGDSINLNDETGSCSYNFTLSQENNEATEEPITSEPSEPTVENEITEPQTDHDYALACSSIDLTDQYLIYLNSDSSTKHNFQVEWTVIQQLLSLKEGPKWIQKTFAYKTGLDPFLSLASEEEASIVFTISSSNSSGNFYYDGENTPKKELTYTVDITGTSNIHFQYQGALEGDIIEVAAHDYSCSDQLVLEKEPEVSDINFEAIDDVEICIDPNFPDVNESTNLAMHIFCLAQADAVHGYAHNGLYGPGNFITNAELTKIVVAMTGEPLASRGDPTGFVDIKNHWAEQYIKKAEQLDIVRPREGVKFNPDAPATRAYLVTLLARGAQKTLWGWSASDLPFNDVSPNDYYAYATIIMNQASGNVPGVGEEIITQGYPDGSFRGNNLIRRDEAAAMLIRGYYALYKN